MLLRYISSFEAGCDQADEFRAMRNWLGRYSTSLVIAKWYYRALYRSYPKHPLRWYAAQQYAVCCRMQHKPRRALNWLWSCAVVSAAELPASERDEPLANIHRDIGMCYSDLGNWPLANAEFEESLKHAPPNSVAQAATIVQIGRMFMRHGEFGEAREYYTTAVMIFASINSNGADKQLLYAYLHTAQNEIADGNGEEARHILIRALGLVDKYGSKAHRFKALVLIAIADRPQLAQSIFHTVAETVGQTVNA